jgi:hypothetical protein
MTEAQQRLLLNALTIGCDRATAAEFARITPEELTEALTTYPDLTRELAQAEATAELNHIRTLHEAKSDPKHWRASAFWLRQHDPDRYARPAYQITQQQLADFAELLLAEIAAVFPDERLHAVHEKIAGLIERFETRGEPAPSAAADLRSGAQRQLL